MAALPSFFGLGPTISVVWYVRCRGALKVWALVHLLVWVFRMYMSLKVSVSDAPPWMKIRGSSDDRVKQLDPDRPLGGSTLTWAVVSSSNHV